MSHLRSSQPERGHAEVAASQDIEQVVDVFIEKFEPGIAECIRACRSELRRQLPGAFELVYDNYSFFVIGFCPTERPSDCIVSLAASANGVALSFYRGVEVPDPDGLLQGDGKQNRFVRLPDVSALHAPCVQTLIQAASYLGPPLVMNSGVTIVRSVSARQRPRRRSAAPDR
jgi:hypothetical protein